MPEKICVQQEEVPIDWAQVERVVVSPGISPKHPIYSEALGRGIPVVGEAELALPFFTKPLVAVTGTNGKTTVAFLVEHILNASGIKAKALGNVGTALCHQLLHPKEEEAFVVELSSYQLETMVTPVFDAGVLLNVTPDHLDRYEGMEQYAAVKCRLQQVVKKGAPFFVHSRVAAEWGSVLTPGFQVYDQQGGLPEEMAKHDRENTLAALALCEALGVSTEMGRRALPTFCKPAHRIEFVREIGGVSFYDDSKGTNIDAVIQAVMAMKGAVILIVGGVDKGASYLPWKEAFAGKVKQMIAIGQAASKVEEELHPYFKIKRAETLLLAVESAARDAAEGDCVLLSPGCSSFDMFRDYKHRGEEFQRIVNKLRRES